MVNFEKFVNSMPPSLSELKVAPSFCFPFKIPDDPTASNVHFVPGQYLKNIVKSMPLSLSELKVKPSFCFPFKIPDDPTATSK